MLVSLINVLVVFFFLTLREDNQQSFGNSLSQFDELLSVQFVGMCTVQTQFISLYYLVGSPYDSSRGYEFF